jgi:putative membrane protein
MRLIYGFILLVFLAAIGIFALQNREPITLEYLDRTVSCPPSLLIAIVYGLGMVSGWTVIGLVQRSLRRVTAHTAR